MRRFGLRERACMSLLALALLLTGPADVAQARSSVPDDYNSGPYGCASGDGYGGSGGYGGYGGYGGGSDGDCTATAPRPKISTFPVTPRANAQITIFAFAEGRGLTYEWDLDDDGTYDSGLPGNADHSEVKHTFATVGAHRIRVRATDEDGRHGTAELTVHVHAGNAAPQGSLGATPTAPHIGTQITVHASGYDRDGSIASIDYDLDANGTFETSPPIRAPVTTSFSSAGERTLRARFVDDDGAATIATTTVAVHDGNYAPIVSVSAYPSEPRPGREVSIYAYAEDPDGTVGHYEFDLDGDGTYETDTGTSDVATHTFSTTGSAEIGARVTDDDGATSVARGSVQVSDRNSAPTASLSASSTPSGISYQVFASDFDGTIAQVAWDLDGDLVYEDRVQAATGSFVFDQGYLPTPAPGSYELGVRVTDQDGGVVTHRSVYVVRDAVLTSPTISTGFFAQQPRVGDNVTFQTSSQPGVSYAWDLDDDGDFDDGDGSLAQRTFPAAGSYEIHVQASNEDGATAVGHATATISPPTGNLAPGVSLFASPSQPRVGTSVFISAGIRDADGIASYAWDLDGDGAFDDATSSFAQRTFGAPGSYLVSVRVVDRAGATAIQRLVIDAHTGNIPPAISLVRSGLVTDEALVGQVVTLFVSQSLGDDSPTQFAWDTDEDGQFDDFVDSFQTSHTVSFATAGVHRVRVRAVDQGGAADIATYVLTVAAPASANRRPVPRIDAQPSVAPGRTVTFYGDAYDPDSDTVTLAWDLDDDGDFDDATGYNALTSYAATGVHRVRVRATDGGGAVATATTSIDVRAPRIAPVIDTFETSASPRVGRPAALYAYAYDPDGEATTLTFDLDGDGTFDDMPAGGPFAYEWTPASTTPRTIGVRATDAGGMTAAKTLQVQPTDGNLGPLASIRQRPGVNLAGHTARFYASAQDPDGPDNELAYEWDVDGDGFDDGNDDYVEITLPHGQVDIALRVTDADGAATIVRESFQIGTQPPAASFVMSDSSPDENVAVHFTSTAQPRDSPIVAQQWDLDDDGHFDDASGPAATHAFPAAGQVRVGLKARDADGDNAIAYSVLRVRSTTAPTAAFDASPDFPDTTDDVTFTSTSTDPQGDGDIATQEWDLDGDELFDDATGAEATTTFAEAGSHLVRLRVTDHDDHVSIAKLYIWIDGAPQPQPPPANDDFAHAATISAATPELRGSTSRATAELGEPAHGDGGPAHSVWARYVATTTGPVTFGTCGSTFDTALAVYSGMTLATLVRVAGNDDGGCGDATSEVRFDAIAGQTYSVAVDGWGGDAGSYRLSLHPPSQTPVPAGDAIADAIVLGMINDLPATNVGATKEPGEPNHAGESGGHSVWFVLHAPSAATVAVDVCRAGFDTLLAVYTRDASGALHAVTANDDSSACSFDRASSVQFPAAAGADYYVAVDGSGGATGNFRLRTSVRPATVSGVVTDKITGEPLSGIRVLIHGPSVTYGVFTDFEGRYSAEYLPVGTYKVSFNDSSGTYRERWYDDADTLEQATPVVLTLGQTRSDVDGALTRLGGISGTVTDAGTGNPIADIQIVVYTANGTPDFRFTTTDASGRYTVDRLAPGQYIVQFVPSAGLNYVGTFYNGKSAANADRVTVVEGLQTGGIDQQLEVGGRISGVVRDSETGDPIADVLVTSYGQVAGEWVHAYGESGADGRFTVQGLPTGTFTLYLGPPSSGYYFPSTNAGSVAVTAGADVALPDTVLQAGGRVAGTVRDFDDGTPLAGAQVWVFAAVSGSFVMATTSDSQGRYSLGALAAGEYTVHFVGPDGYGTQYYDQQPASGTAITVVKRATTAGIDARLVKLPVNTVAPAVSGTPRQGQTLSATSGQWSSNTASVTRQWLRCNAAASTSCSPINGATAATYTLGSADAGFRMAVEETATNLGGSAAARSAPTAVVVPLPPVNTGAPSIFGTPRNGEQLFANTGSWQNSPTNFDYQWRRCNSIGSACQDISGATASSYTAAELDIGLRVVVRVVAHNAGGDSEPAVSAASSVIVRAPPSNLTAPTITGEAKQGETLTADHGSWDGEPTAYAYSWRRCSIATGGCTSTGGTSSTYTPRAADVGSTMVVVVTASNEGGASSPATSAQTEAVVASRPINTAPPTISGLAKQGQTLFGQHGSWTNEPTSFAYTWLACPEDDPCAPIPGANGLTFVPGESEVGDVIVLRVVASNPAGASLAATSTGTDPVLPPIPSVVTRPTISGSAIEGQTLTLHRGTWTNEPTSFTQQWARCQASGTCQAIDGATDITYTLVAADVGNRIVVSERAVNAAGSGVALSDPTAPVVVGPPANLDPPTISGTPREEQPLTAQRGTWTNAPDSYAYQWLRCTAPADCIPIDGATGQRYAVRFADAGRTLVVDVSATNAGGTGGPVRSAPTATVVAADPPDTQITLAPEATVSTDTQSIHFDSNRAGAQFECRLGTDPFTQCSSPKTYAGLAEGVYMFEVRARDAQDRVDASPAVATWTVDRTPPDTSISSGPEAPVHDTATFDFATTEPAGTFQCAVDDGPYSSCRSGGALDLDGLSPGEHVFRVRAIDGAGNIDPTAATRTFTFANDAPVASLVLTPDAGAVALDVAAAIGATDGDAGDRLAFKLDFGDGHVINGALPHAAVDHTYDRVGLYTVRLEVDDGHESDIVVRHATVVLAEPLHADAGDDIVAVAGETTTLDGRGSRPAAGIETATWTFGDGQAGSGPKATHVYSAAGTYTATLSVRAGGQTDTDSASVHVIPATGAPGLAVTVSSGGGPVAGADVLVIAPDGRRVSDVTDGTGKTRLRGLDDGAYTVLTYADGYLPASTPASVADSSGSTDVELTAGSVVDATLTHRRLSRDEILTLGIDPDDPDNQIVSEFEIHLNGSSFQGYVNGNGLHGPGCSGIVCRVDFGGGGGGSTTYIGYHDLGDGAQGVSTFTLPSRARWLKEFFEVKMTIYNLAAPGFVLRNGRARLTLPDGVSLAPTARGEELSKPIGDIAGGSSASADWIVRGDTAGEYNLTADYAATLEPFGHSVSTRAQTVTPLKVWGENALKPIVEVDKQYRNGYPLSVRIGLRNVADIPVYDAEVALLDGERVGYVDQPRQQSAYGAREIAPGETAWLGPWILVPSSDGEIDVSRSFVKHVRGAELGAFEFRTRDRSPTFDATPRLMADAQDGGILLHWEPVPGATGYEVYEVADRESPFPADPSPVDYDGTSALAPPLEPGEKRYYAVSTIVNGRHTMVHPILEAPPPPPAGEGDEDPFGPPTGTCGLTSVRLGPAEFLASCFTKDGDRYTASGRVRVNGIDLFPQGARVVVDVAKARVTVDEAKVKLGSVTLYVGKIEWSPSIKKTFELPGGTQIGHLPIEGSLAVSLTPDRAELEGKVKLPGMAGLGGTLKLGATNPDGPKLDLFEITATGLSIGRLGLDELSLKYKRTSVGDRWEGGAGMLIPRAGGSMKLKGSVTILDGKFKGASLEADNINQHIAWGVFLQRLRGALEVNPLAVEGEIGISAGPNVLGTTLVGMDGRVTASFGDPQRYSLSGELTFVNVPVRSGYIRYSTDGLLELGGKMGFEKGPFKAEVGVDGWIDGVRAANVKGYGEFSVPGVSFSAEGVASTVGIAACRHGAGPDVGAGYRWGDGDVHIFASGCDVGPYEATRSAHDRAGANSFTVAPESPLEVLALHGDVGAPRVVLVGPDGRRIEAPAGGRGIDEPDVMLVQYPDHRTTYVAIYRPAAGEWTVGTAPGSVAVTSIQRAGALPEPKVAAEVQRSGTHAILRWQFNPIAGQEVQLVERSANGARVITTTSEETGSAVFTPLSDDDAGRSIEAVVTQNGMPRRVITVERFKAPASSVTPAGAAPGPGARPGGSVPSRPGAGPAARPPRSPRPARPARIRLSRRPGTIEATWPAARGAVRYAVEARLPGGRRVAVIRQRRRLIVRRVRAIDRVTVSVRSIGPDGRRSATRVARLEGRR